MEDIILWVMEIITNALTLFHKEAEPFLYKFIAATLVHQLIKANKEGIMNWKAFLIGLAGAFNSPAVRFCMRYFIKYGFITLLAVFGLTIIADIYFRVIDPANLIVSASDLFLALLAVTGISYLMLFWSKYIDFMLRSFPPKK